MAHTRTQIYLDPGQHASLIREAHKLGISLAGLIRRLVDEHFRATSRGPAADERKKGALSLIGLGRSGLSDVSQKVDAYLGGAIYEDMVRERRVPYRRRMKRTR